MSDQKPEWLEHLSVLRLEPGDTVVIRMQHLPSDDMRWRIRDVVEREFPGHRCIVLTDGMEIGVVRRETA